MRAALWLAPTLIGAVVMLGPSLWGGADPVPYDIQHGFLPWSADPDAPMPAENGLLRDLVDTYDPEQRTIWERLRGEGDPGWLEGAGMGAPGGRLRNRPRAVTYRTPATTCGHRV